MDVIFSDGGSQDGTIEKIKAHGFTIVHSPKGRAVQMNAAAHVASGELLLFLHCDTKLPTDFYQSLVNIKNPQWGFFRVKLSGSKRWFRGD